ncbi:hypothetical protein PRIPAC_84000 [Pristionchus pacificus]|uniref:Uncharacterized protein n=1 Tax=Pristionchus pacificus TaxID=54126 RepID=A0A454XY91_PRIPA|nr:hypothetical protein PRIPAC_84000 [Pristionchus pacificus]|eukprot:PDM67166.1 hypothetical protein PRIPAC_48583 [Pristionchus pacificus]
MKLLLILIAVPLVVCIEEVDCDYLNPEYGVATCGLTEGTEPCEHFSDFNSEYPELESIDGHYHVAPESEAHQVDVVGEDCDYVADVDSILPGEETVVELELRECDYHLDIISTEAKEEAKEEL